MLNKSRLKIKDPIILGIAAGLGGTLVKYLGNLVSRELGITNTSYQEIGAGIYMSARKARTPMGMVAGLFADAALGAGLGVGYIYVLKYTGKDHALIKGVGYGHGVWSLFLGGANLIGTASILPLTPKSVISTYVEHALYGAGAALVATTLGDENLFKKEDINDKETVEKNQGQKVESN